MFLVDLGACFVWFMVFCFRSFIRSTAPWCAMRRCWAMRAAYTATWCSSTVCLGRAHGRLPCGAVRWEQRAGLNACNVALERRLAVDWRELETKMSVKHYVTTFTRDVKECDGRWWCLAYAAATAWCVCFVFFVYTTGKLWINFQKIACFSLWSCTMYCLLACCFFNQHWQRFVPSYTMDGRCEPPLYMRGCLLLPCCAVVYLDCCAGEVSCFCLKRDWKTIV